MGDKNGKVLTRREFAQRAALLSATASLTPARAAFNLPDPDVSSQTESKLSDAGQAEANSRYQQIIDLYGSRFDIAQKADLERMCSETQPSLDHIRSYALQNGDQPALFLKPIVERDKKTATAPTAKKP